MKRCLVCGTDADDGAQTCAVCGEASWCNRRRRETPVVQAQHFDADEEPTLPDAAAQPMQQQRRKSRRGRR